MDLEGNPDQSNLAVFLNSSSEIQNHDVESQFLPETKNQKGASEGKHVVRSIGRAQVDLAEAIMKS